MDLRHIAARIRRLDQLSCGLTKEHSIMATGDDPLLYLERQDYLRALCDIVAGLETDRMVLTKARQRLTGQRSFASPRRTLFVTILLSCIHLSITFGPPETWRPFLHY
jgi:hypothetical protein